MDYGLTLFGLSSFIGGLVLFRNGRRELKKLGNSYSVNYAVRPNKLVSNGVYRYSRHPIYLGVMLMVIGVPLCLHSSLVPLYRKKSDTFMSKLYVLYFIQLTGAFAFFDRIEIPREEQVLRDHFGKKYTDYKSVTPKWIGRPLNNTSSSYDEKRNTCNAGKATDKKISKKSVK